MRFQTGLTETAKPWVQTNWQIIRKFYLPESLPTLINAITLTFVTLIGYTAMAGTQGGGGLGSPAINYGVYRNMPSVTWAANDCYRDYRDAQSKIGRHARKTSGSPLIIFYTILFTTRKNMEIKNLFAITAIASALGINRL